MLGSFTKKKLRLINYYIKLSFNFTGDWERIVLVLFSSTIRGGWIIYLAWEFICNRVAFFFDHVLVPRFVFACNWYFFCWGFGTPCAEIFRLSVIYFILASSKKKLFEITKYLNLIYSDFFVNYISLTTSVNHFIKENK